MKVLFVKSRCRGYVQPAGKTIFPLTAYCSILPLCFFNGIIQGWKCPVAVGCPDSIMNPDFLNVLPDSHHIDAGWQTERLLPCFVMTGQYPAAIPSIDGQDRRNGQRRPQTSLPHADLATDRFACNFKRVALSRLQYGYIIYKRPTSSFRFGQEYDLKAFRAHGQIHFLFRPRTGYCIQNLQRNPFLRGFLFTIHFQPVLRFVPCSGKKNAIWHYRRDCPSRAVTPSHLPNFPT